MTKRKPHVAALRGVEVLDHERVTSQGLCQGKRRSVSVPCGTVFMRHSVAVE